MDLFSARSLALSIIETSVGFPQLPELAIYVGGFMCSCFGSLGSPSMPWSLWTFDLAHWAHPLCCKVCVFFFHLPGPALWPQGLCVLQICMPYLVPHSGPPSAPRDFSGLPLVPWACHLVGAIVCELFMVWGVQLSLFCAL